MRMFARHLLTAIPVDSRSDGFANAKKTN